MTPPSKETVGSLLASEERLQEKLHAQRLSSRKNGPPDHRQRRNLLDTLLRGILNRQEEFVKAISDDFGGRAREETLALEVLPVAEQIRHARRHVKQWMKPRAVRTGWQFFPGRSRILCQPLGVVGIIGAWNYPLLLTLSPLVCALAAGNRVMIKPSELAPRTADLLQKMIAELFPAETVTVITGDADVSAAFAALAFDHLLFTGSSRVGKLVMKAASENLTPVTLELGGKCPALVHKDYPLERAARRILAGKLYNAGQTCLAPDYVMLPEEKQEAFLELAQAIVPRLYPLLVENPDYTRIISREHYQRLCGLLEDAIRQGASVLQVNTGQENCSAANTVFPPTLVYDVKESMAVMQEEIFGPILPVVPYARLEEAIGYVNLRPHPLALYYFDHNSRRVSDVLARTTSGGATVNDAIFHFAQLNLPFGGVGPSGMGHYHGFAGFETFSKKKGVFLQTRFAATGLLQPPYGETTRSLIRFLIGN